MQLDLEKVRADVRQATTEDLLDRATVYRAGLEPEALDLIDAELHRRGVRPAEIEAHAESRSGRLVLGPDGHPVPCQKCHRPATMRGWGLGKLWGLVPLFPRPVAFCDEHRSSAWSEERGA
jgi:hypothetical protein